MAKVGPNEKEAYLPFRGCVHCGSRGVTTPPGRCIGWGVCIAHVLSRRQRWCFCHHLPRLGRSHTTAARKQVKRELHEARECGGIRVNAKGLLEYYHSNFRHPRKQIMNLAKDIHSVTPLMEEAVDRWGNLATKPDWERGWHRKGCLLPACRLFSTAESGISAEVLLAQTPRRSCAKL